MHSIAVTAHDHALLLQPFIALLLWPLYICPSTQRHVDSLLSLIVAFRNGSESELRTCRFTADLRQHLPADVVADLCSNLRTDTDALFPDPHSFGIHPLHWALWCQFQSRWIDSTDSYYSTRSSSHICLQCFDAIGWVAGRASGL